MDGNSYDIGDLVILRARFTDPETGNPVDPGAVVCTVKPPSSAKTKPSVNHPVLGEFTVEVAPDKAGTWVYAFDATGGFQAAQEKKFYVKEQLIPR